jgi:hypothetical protein
MNRVGGLVYRLNRRDEFTYIDEKWGSFAAANDALDLLPGLVLSRPLWDFISDETTAQLYREILRRARAGHVARFGFRCDAPEYRRSMEMTVAGLGGGEVQFETRVLREERRPRQELLGRYAARAGDMLRMCGWCKRVDVGAGRWEEVEEAVRALCLFERQAMPPLTHGICEACFRAMNKKAAERQVRA